MCKVVDKYGVELNNGDMVCFVHKHSVQSQYIVKAVVSKVTPMKEDKDFPNLNKNRGWVHIEKYVDDFMQYEKNAKTKVMAERVVKCY